MISVCIATYNGGRFIKRQLETILEQMGDGDEVVVSDDGSTDNTIEIIESLKSPLIHIYMNGGEHGYTSNFENALRHAKGDYIFLSDQDDVWLDKKIDVCMKVLSTYDFVVSDARIVDEDENILFPSFYAKRLHFKGFWGNMLTMGYIGCCMAFRRCVLERALPFPSDHKLCTHDNWIVVVAMMYYRAKVINDKLVGYRRHGKNISSGISNARMPMIFRLKYRLYLLFHILGRCQGSHSNV